MASLSGITTPNVFASEDWVDVAMECAELAMCAQEKLQEAMPTGE